MRWSILSAVLLPYIALGDAGYLGSVVQGPVPLSGHGTEVRMLAQDVLILVDRTAFEITGCFLFYSPGDEGPIHMYFPVDVVTPFIGCLYSALEPGRFIERVSVSVDGTETEVFPLFIDEWEPDPEDPVDWERVRELTLPLSPDEPAPGEPFYATRIPTMAVLTGSTDEIDSLFPAFEFQAMNAAWEVGFGAGDTVLVEYHVTGDMTMDYFETMSMLCYPLQTGSTWAGSIGEGRVIVVPADSGKLEQMTFSAGVMLPPPERESPLVFRPLQAVSDRPGFAGSRLSQLAGCSFDGGIVWSFADFEPEVAPTGWRGLYPGLGDMYGAEADSLMMWRYGESDVKPTGWAGSFIYLYLADQRPSDLTVIAVDGIPMLESPCETAGEIVNLPMTTQLSVRAWRGSWARVEATLYEYLTGVETESFTGWIDVDRTGPEGLTPPGVLPML